MNGKVEKIRKVLKLMAEFKEVANIVLKEAEEDNCLFIRGNKNTAKLKRVSMDVTRALAEYRKA